MRRIEKYLKSNIPALFLAVPAAAAAAVLFFFPALVPAAEVAGNAEGASLNGESEETEGAISSGTGSYGTDEVAVNENGILTVGYVMIGAESDWRLACNKSVEEAFTRANGYSLLVSDAQQKQEKQIKAVREFINQEVDYILLNPIVESGWDASLEEAREAGIPVIAFDREVDVKAENAYTAWLGSDFYLEGEKACAWLAAFLETNASDALKEDGIGLVHIQGTLNSSAQLGRTKALDDMLEKHPEVKLLDRQSGDFTTAKGKEVMVDMLSRFGGDIDIVYCENDNEAYGAIEAIREAGRIPGSDIASGEILILSFDATHNGLAMTMDGQIASNTECAPLYGPLLTQLIQAIERGEEIPERQYVHEEQFSALAEPETVIVRGETFPVRMVTKEVIDSRTY